MMGASHSSATDVSPELICPAGTPAGLTAAIDAGADAVYCGFQNATNARNFPGLNFTSDELAEGVAYAHARGRKVLLALNTFPPAGQCALWENAVNEGARLGVDAFIVADMGVADYAARKQPQVRRHLSVQAGAASIEAINFYCEAFGIKRVVLPRILTIDEIGELHAAIPCEIETFIFGNHGLMAEGRCSLSNYATGYSTNMDGVCSPAQQVQYREDATGTLTTKLGDFVIDRFEAGAAAGYPTICKGRYCASCHETPYYAFEEPISLNLATLLPQMISAGVTAFKIEGRQRSRAYVQTVVAAFRKAMDDCLEGRQPALTDLLALTEGQKQTEGAFKTKKWR